MVKESNFKQLSISLIIPVYNEEQAIHSALESNLNALKKYLTTFEIIIVNDGSTDNSQLVIDDCIKEKDGFISIAKIKNEGMGSAIRMGIEQAKYDYILPVPADCPLDENTLHLFLSNLHNNDILIGFRPKRVGYSLRMKINSIVFHKLITWLFKINLIDYNWIHVYKRKIFFEDGISISSNGIMMLAEILIKAKRKGLQMKEVEIIQRARLTGTATAARFITVLKTIVELFSLHKELNR